MGANSPPGDGHGFNHVVFISRRHIIDEMQIDDNGFVDPTGMSISLWSLLKLRKIMLLLYRVANGAKVREKNV